MIDLLVNTLILSYTYVLVFVIYFALIIFASKNINLYVRKFKYVNVVSGKLAVIIYVNDKIKKDTISKLLESLKKQEYDKENYEVNIILDGCNDEVSNLLEFIGGAKIYKVGALGNPIGKDEAISIVIERIFVSYHPLGLVFLDPKRRVSEKFLSSVNIALSKDKVVVGMTQIEENKNTDLYSKVISAYLNYKNRIINFGRTVLKLGTIFDSDVCAMKSEAIEKIQCFESEYPFLELHYTLQLAKKRLCPVFNPCVITYVNVDNYNYKNVNIISKLRLFFEFVPSIIKVPSKKYIEIIFSLIQPNIFTLSLIIITVSVFSYVYYFFYDFKIVIGSVIILILLYISTLFISKTNYKNAFFMSLMPFLFLIKKKQSIINNKNKINLSKFKTSEQNFEKKILNVYVTDGRNDLECKLELYQNDGFFHVIFKYKRKKYITEEYTTLNDAIDSISEKLKKHGFRLKICKDCAYFNITKGFCGICSNKAFDSENGLLEPNRNLWSGCKLFVYNDPDKLININHFKNGKC